MRKISKFVLCIKNNKNDFTKGNYYKVDGIFGDPHRAIEEFGINEFMPVECISKVLVLNDKNIKKEFFVNRTYYRTAGYDIYSKNFFEYFEIPEFSDIVDKFNI